MAYLSEDKITGKVLVNVSCKDGKIIGYSDDSIFPYITRMVLSSSYISTTTGGISPLVGKFADNGIRPNIYFQRSDYNSFDYSKLTLSAWVYKSIDANNDDLISIGVDLAGIYLANRIHLRTEIHTFINPSPGLQVKPNLAKDKSWNHLAITKDDATIYFFVNGTKIREQTLSTNYSKGNSEYMVEADRFNGADGCVDDLTYIVGQCVWKDDFKVPTEPLVGNMKYSKVLYYSHNVVKNSLKYL